MTTTLRKSFTQISLIVDADPGFVHSVSVLEKADLSVIVDVKDSMSELSEIKI